LTTDATASGSLVSFYDSHSRQLYVASDARSIGAVLARRVRDAEGHHSYTLTAFLSGGALPTIDTDAETVLLPQELRDVVSEVTSDRASISAAVPTATSVTILPGDQLIIASKSLWRNVTNAEATQAVAFSGSVPAVWNGPLVWASDKVIQSSPKLLLTDCPDGAPNAARHLIHTALRRMNERGLQCERSESLDISVCVVVFNDVDGSV